LKAAICPVTRLGIKIGSQGLQRQDRLGTEAEQDDEGLHGRDGKRDSSSSKPEITMTRLLLIAAALSHG
jgi:hypothetical protein